MEPVIMIIPALQAIYSPDKKTSHTKAWTERPLYEYLSHVPWYISSLPSACSHVIRQVRHTLLRRWGINAKRNHCTNTMFLSIYLVWKKTGPDISYPLYWRWRYSWVRLYFVSGNWFSLSLPGSLLCRILVLFRWSKPIKKKMPLYKENQRSDHKRNSFQRIQSGRSESPFLNGQIPFEEWRCWRY